MILWPRRHQGCTDPVRICASQKEEEEPMVDAIKVGEKPMSRPSHLVLLEY